MTIACSRSSSAVTAKATSRGALSRRSSGKAIAAGSRRCGVSRFSSSVCLRRLQYGIEYANSFTTRICTRAKICCASARVKFRFEPSRLTGNVLDLIWVTDGTTQEVNLPTHFESRDLNFGGGLGIGRFHQFGSPVWMYVSGGS
ncbi:MAG TPA: hypothetical protein VEV85_08040 [Bryobacteraceae bacterium]|nr:hypothetical protein [Bryobacteraceae bacterium]